MAVFPFAANVDVILSEKKKKKKLNKNILDEQTDSNTHKSGRHVLAGNFGMSWSEAGLCWLFS